MAKSILETKTDPLTYKRIPFEKITVKKPAKPAAAPTKKIAPRISRITHKPMNSNAKAIPYKPGETFGSMENGGH